MILSCLITLLCDAQGYYQYKNGNRQIVYASEVDSLIFFSGNPTEDNPEEHAPIPRAGNILYGKKWVACGDSFTEGDFNSLTNPADYIFQDGPYKGKKKVYPYYIGRRNNMKIVNEAISGSIMALDKTFVADSVTKDINTRSPFSYKRYKNPELADADYITLWFGINDVSNTNLGNIEDVTNETYYGAWNVVLEYLIRQNPFAKIGIIITNGSGSWAYKNATRQIARKWGIPYLDMSGDYQVPAIFERQIVTADDPVNLGYTDVARQIRTEAFRVSATNGHPNARCHEYESFFIENWLRSL